MKQQIFLFCLSIAGILFAGCQQQGGLCSDQELALNDSGYFETPGLNVMIFSNWYDGSFDDAKIAGVEMIHHGVRTVTNGDVRLNPTPGQWDALPEFIERKVDRENQRIVVSLNYSNYNFNYNIVGEARDGGMYVSVQTEQPVPEALVGIAGFNLEFLPSVYWGKSFVMDDTNGLFPLYPSSNMIPVNGETEPAPLAVGKKIDLAPEDPERHITITSADNDLQLFDGRNKAQNGWFVVRSLLPANKSGKIMEWFITAETLNNWIRKPVIAHSQVGYHPAQQKVAVIELDKNDTHTRNMQLLKVNNDGSIKKALSGKPKPWGRYLRYNYLTFDFSSIKEKGIYRLQYGDVITASFRIDENVYQNAWHPTLDVYYPVQMDHLFVREAYRVWHGDSHRDDALQAPINHHHFDLYAQGATTGNKYKPLQHIPGLNVGGWYDAGDFDIRTQTQHAVIMDLVRSWEQFGIDRDETTIDQKTRQVQIHVPDGQPDILQQIEHGVIQLLAQQKSVGYAVNGIVESHIEQYRHLGDAVNKTDNIAGNADDRWAFTNKSTPLNYGSAAALASASRALKGYNANLAAECLHYAQKIWTEEHSHQPDLFVFTKGHLNTIGGALDAEEFRAAVELLQTTGEERYKQRVNELYPAIQEKFGWFAGTIAQAIPYMDASFKKQVEPQVKEFIERLKENTSKANPFGVFISTGGWAGNGGIIQSSITCYLLHQQFPELVDPELVYQGLNYIYGTHPDSDISFVSAVGAHSKKVAYGNNRADFTFIAGGIVPGVLILKPDFPENKEDYPFFWGENEYVVNLGASYIFLVNAVDALLNNR
ncbi:MAG: glycoside hydrolase family 9 protein [Candidatus Symbiothrix sp.]|nr:glycoside hydrolase family 9 protein [Candidatus Symbiothrix sp.]